MPWATVQQVTDQTGQTVTTATLALASGVIDTYAGTDPEMPESAITARDRATLRKATAWQAAWIANQPGYLTHRGVDYSPNADGTSGQRKSQADQDLAPLAQRELKNLSWVGTRVMRVGPGRTHLKGAHMIDFLNESSDGGYGYASEYPIGSSSSAGLTGWQEITGKPLTFPPDEHAHEMSDIAGLLAALEAAGAGEGGTVSLAWEEITGKPATFPPAAHTHAWASITDKPTTFTPAPHSHAVVDVTGLQAALDGKAAIAYVDAVDGRVIDAEGRLDDAEGRLDALEGAPGGGGGTGPVITRARILTGDVVVAADAAWTPVPGISLAVPAVAGDNLLLTVACLISHTDSSFYELAVLVGGVPVRYASTGTGSPAGGEEGDPSMYPLAGGPLHPLNTFMDFEVEAGDLSGGNVTFALVHKGSGGGKVYASAAFPFRWSARNDGPGA
jgi:hypothetical protein